MSGTAIGPGKLVRVLGNPAEIAGSYRILEQKGARLSFIAPSLCAQYVARTVGLLRGTTPATLGISTATTATSTTTT